MNVELIYVTPLGVPVYVLAQRWYAVGIGWQAGNKEQVIEENMLTLIKADQRSGGEYDLLIDHIKGFGLHV